MNDCSKENIRQWAEMVDEVSDVDVDWSDELLKDVDEKRRKEVYNLLQSMSKNDMFIVAMALAMRVDRKRMLQDIQDWGGTYEDSQVKMMSLLVKMAGEDDIDAEIRSERD